MTNSVTLQGHLSTREDLGSQQDSPKDPVKADDESYTKNVLGDRVETPECVKVLGNGIHELNN